MSNIDKLLDAKLAIAKEYPSMCLAPYSSIYLRQHYDPTKNMRVTCCCNIDVDKFTLGPTSNPLKEITDSMEQGVLPAACHLCKKEEANNAQSERIRFFLLEELDSIEKFINTTKVERYELMVVFSNLCNLSCRSCGSTNSSTYAKITNDHSADHLIKDITDIEEYWDRITQVILTNIDRYENFDIHLMGGEPLIQAGVVKLFDWLLENKFTDKITLKITTALSANLTDEMLQYFKQFRYIHFNLSIDSVGENYQYVRWPMKFEKIERNINYIVDNLDSKKYSCSLDPVFSLNNIFYIDEYLDYWHKWITGKQIKFIIASTNLIANTALIDVQALPVKYRSHLKSLLKTCLNHPMFDDYPQTTIHLYNFIKSTIVELELWKDDEYLWNRYLKHTAEFDKRTNTQFNVLNSKLYNLLTNEDRILFDSKLSQVNVTTRYSIFSK